MRNNNLVLFILSLSVLLSACLFGHRHTSDSISDTDKNAKSQKASAPAAKKRPPSNRRAVICIDSGKKWSRCFQGNMIYHKSRSVCRLLSDGTPDYVQWFTTFGDQSPPRPLSPIADSRCFNCPANVEATSGSLDKSRSKQRVKKVPPSTVTGKPKKDTRKPKAQATRTTK